MAVVISVAGVFFVPWMVTRIPVNYFARDEAPPMPWAEAHPLLRTILHGGKNLLGGLLVIAGIVMLVLPGQGLLTLFVGFLFVEFPGKRRLEIWLVRRRAVHRVIDWVRQRAGREPLDLGDYRE